MPEKDKSERVRVKAKYADIVRQVAAVRNESFIDALYRIIDSYWDYQNGRVGAIAPSKPAISTHQTSPDATPDLKDIDTSGFE